ncbi:hypothetical protein D770_04815 [Flammeovirgaceae bacterium 311]|nr:hypothetical protein D770_04815 [Flammeovirgaceae bacterium 311]
MTQYFLKRYKYKLKKELEHIVSFYDAYNKSAVKAAVQLLDEEHGVQIPLPFKDKKFSQYEKDELTYEHYFKTFSIREVASAFSLAILFIAMVAILTYLREARWIDEHYTLLLFLILLLIFTLNHVFYKQEHGRRNLFAGRIIQNALTLTFIFLFVNVLYWIRGDGTLSFEGNTFIVVLGFLIVLFLAEGIISLIRRILTLLKWHIW